MARDKDINSTEKLLNVIRGSETKQTAPESDVTRGTRPTKPSSNLFSFISRDRRYTIGVDIGHERLNLVKTTKGPDAKPILVDQKIVSLNPSLNRNAVGFQNFLKEELTTFATDLSACDIWGMIPAAEVNIHHIKVPRVAKKQLENVIYWTAKKEITLDEKETIFDFELQGDITDQGIPKYAVMVYTAPRQEVERIQQTFSQAGIALTGITIAPFAIQNIFRTKWMKPSEATFANLFIGTDFSRIDVYHHNHLALTRGIKTGINSMIEGIEESIAPGDETVAVERETIKQSLKSFFSSAQSASTHPDLALSEASIMEMITPALERLVRQIERTLEYYTTQVGYERIEKLFISSTVNMDRPLIAYFNEQLSVPTELFDPLENRVTEKTRQAFNQEDRIALSPALGLALSDNQHTPNLIFTYIEKSKKISDRNTNRIILAASALALMVCLTVLAFQALELRHSGYVKSTLEAELNTYQPLLTPESVNRVALDVKVQRQLRKQYAKKYLGVAAIGEISVLTPQDVRLVRVQLAKVRVTPETAKAQTAPKAPAVQEVEIIIEGVVLGDRAALDGMLAQYVMRLQNSPMIRQVTLQKSSPVTHRKGEILHFTLHAKVG